MKVEVELKDYQVDKLEEVLAYAAECGEEIDEARALVMALMQVKTDDALRAPIYQEVFVDCEEGDDGAFPVRFAGGEAVWAGWLRKVSLEDAFATRQKRPLAAVYVAIKHDILYPYAAVDCTEVITDEQKAFFEGVFAESDWKPRQFCRATFAATPQMHLIG
jgi:hypothetical protein